MDHRTDSKKKLGIKHQSHEPVEDTSILHMESGQSDLAKQLQLVTDALPVLISYVDSERRYRFVNKTYQEWFGHATDEIIGMHVREIVGETAYDEIRPAIDRVLSGEHVNFDRLLPFKNGDSRFVSVNYMPDIDANGGINGFFRIDRGYLGPQISRGAFAAERSYIF